MSTIISVENLTKTYRLGSIGGKTLQEDFARWWAKVRGRPDPLLKIGSEHHARLLGEQFWALDNVSFEVKAGEVLGVIGRNGAGKSTLLKILSQVTAPSSGQMRLRGRVASLLEVGTGFHPDLTGRENVFMNGAILGMTRVEIRQKFDEIVAFSECGEFIDTPVKRYSSGMYVRLAFAVAAHLEPEILVVDEVLAVGDSQFQRKCLGKMGDVSRQGRTIIFVSHSMGAVKALCTRALLLRDGKVQLDADVATATAAYQATDSGNLADGINVRHLPRRGLGQAKFSTLEVTPVDRDGKVLPAVVTGCDLLVKATIESLRPVEAANVGVELYDADGYRLVDINTALHADFLTMKAGQLGTATFRMRDLLLKPGNYRLNLWLGRGGIEDIDYVEFAGRIHVIESMDTKHTEVFPGPYQCRFTHNLTVQAAEPPAGKPDGKQVLSTTGAAV